MIFMFSEGSEDHEIICKLQYMFIFKLVLVSDILSSFIQTIKLICAKRGISESTLTSDYSIKIILALDEMIQHGIIDQIDPVIIRNYVDFKFEEIKKK